MTGLRRVRHYVRYDGAEEALADKAARALSGLNLTSLSHKELLELFAGPGELPIEATLIDAELLRESFARIGFDASVIRESDDIAGSPIIEFKQNTQKLVTFGGITGIVCFVIAGLLQGICSILPIPLFRVFALQFHSSISFLILLPLIVTEGYLAGTIMTIFHYGALMGFLIGILMGMLQMLSLAGAGSVVLPIIGAILIGWDIRIKSGSHGALPTDARSTAWRYLSRPVTYFAIAHVTAAAMCYPIRLI
ncbi:MAG: hypothetical protein JW941_05385 [Candidatus Coatesbacteria bacterium]|nr:hypothetical protein [Candidatus Coatesbacteria bacterium]